MSVFARFFGKSDADDSGAGQLVAHPKIEYPLNLQVLFAPGFVNRFRRLMRVVLT
jgi:hypothetical protein